MSQKLAIVTGSSRGIGSGIVNEFLKDESWTVLGISRSSNKKAINSPNYKELLLDLMLEDSIELLKKEIEEICGEFELMSFVHNFGLTAHTSLLETKKDVWENIFKANVTIPFLCAKEVGSLMKKGSSHIFIGSTLSTMAVPNASAYIASKHALAGLMRSVAVEFADKGIRANLVCPGFTETDMGNDVVFNSAKTSKMDKQELKQLLENLSPLKRFLMPDEIGEYVVFLANKPTINGEILHINGGFGLVK